jgi:hypothetical protein
VSVPKGQRSGSKLDTQVACEELIEHTVKIIANERHFKPENAKLHERIIDTALRIGQGVWEANGIRVRTADDFRERHALQERAIRDANALLYLMTVSARLDHLRKGKYHHWAELARKARDMTRAWRDSDARRYGHLIREEG